MRTHSRSIERTDTSFLLLSIRQEMAKNPFHLIVQLGNQDMKNRHDKNKINRNKTYSLHVKRVLYLAA